MRDAGIIVNVTPFEPEWEGFVTLEISNTTPLPARVYANEGALPDLCSSKGRTLPRRVTPIRRGSTTAQRGIVLPKL